MIFFWQNTNRNSCAKKIRMMFEYLRVLLYSEVTWQMLKNVAQFWTTIYVPFQRKQHHFLESTSLLTKRFFLNIFKNVFFLKITMLGWKVNKILMFEKLIFICKTHFLWIQKMIFFWQNTNRNSYARNCRLRFENLRVLLHGEVTWKMFKNVAQFCTTIYVPFQRKKLNFLESTFL